MKTSIRPAFPFIAAFLLFVHSHDARGLTLLSDDRFVRTYQREEPLPPVETLTTPAIPFGPFHVDELQDSAFSFVEGTGSGDVLTGHATGAGGGGVSFGSSSSSVSEFAIQFRIDGPSAWLEVSGVLDGTQSAFISFTNGVELRMGSTVLHTESIHFLDFAPIPTPFAFALALEPGDYRLTAFAGGTGGMPGVFTTGTYDVEFRLVEAVPEPGTALLVAIGAAGLASTRRRRAREAQAPDPADASCRASCSS